MFKTHQNRAQQTHDKYWIVISGSIWSVQNDQRATQNNRHAQEGPGTGDGMIAACRASHETVNKIRNLAFLRPKTCTRVEWKGRHTGDPRARWDHHSNAASLSLGNERAQTRRGRPGSTCTLLIAPFLWVGSKHNGADYLHWALYLFRSLAVHE